MKNLLKNQRGITLIALVITIIVLLILAGVSIATLTGQNGILTQANNAKTQTEQADVKEAVSLSVTEYNLEKEIEGLASQVSFMDWMKQKGYINAEGIIQIKNLLGKTLSTGNGTGTTDVYKLEEVISSAKLASNVKVAATTENEKQYKITYYDKNGTPNILNTFSLNTSATLEETDPSLFEITADGTISLKDYDSYYDNEKEWTIETLVIPSEIDGIKVTKIADKFFQIGTINRNKIKNLYVPNGVTEIGIAAFSNCEELKSVNLPETLKTINIKAFEACIKLTNINIPQGISSVGMYAFSSCMGIKEITIPLVETNISGKVFYNWESSQTIHVPFKEGELPEGWDSEWNANCNAMIDYQE